MIDDAIDNTQIIGCFIAGTLVRVQRDNALEHILWKAIEQLKVGDLVLSMPEDGSTEEKAYKRVVKTFKSSTKQKIVSPVYDIFCTENHPFWVVEGRARSDGTWVRADDLNWNDSLYQLAAVTYGWDKAEPRYNAWQRDPYELGGLYLIATDQDGIAIFLKDNFGTWIADQNVGMVDFRAGYPQKIFTNDKESFLGSHCYVSDVLTDGLNYKYLDKDKHQAEIAFYNDLLDRFIVPDWENGEKSEIYSDYVYNIEVEDYHTYFVGEAGVWVHNTNCTASVSGTIDQIRQDGTV